MKDKIKLNKNKINHRKENFGGLIINLETGKIFKLNKIGYKIFLDLYKNADLKKVITGLQKKYRADFEGVYTDAKEFIKKLAKEGFVLKN
jgi:hypothetical protein